MPHKHYDPNSARSRTINPGDSGIWATCVKGKERKALGELRDLFNEVCTPYCRCSTAYGDQYAEMLYADQIPSTGNEEAMEGADDVDIEKEIKQELEGIRKPGAAKLFEPVMLDVQCGERLLYSVSLRPI